MLSWTQLSSVQVSWLTNDSLHQLIKQLLDLADSAQKNEPGTLKYAVCIPRDPAKQTEIWMLEE